jgi:hypothetical protein
MSREMKSLYRADNSATDQVEWLDYSHEHRPGAVGYAGGGLVRALSKPGGRVRGIAGEADIRAGHEHVVKLCLLCRRRAAPHKLGEGRACVRAEISAPALAAQKWRKVKYNEAQQYQLTNVTVSAGIPGLASGTCDRLNFRQWTPAFDMQVAWAPSGVQIIDLATAGRRVTAHWAATLAASPCRRLPTHSPAPISRTTTPTTGVLMCSRGTLPGGGAVAGDIQIPLHVRLHAVATPPAAQGVRSHRALHQNGRDVTLFSILPRAFHGFRRITVQTVSMPIPQHRRGKFSARAASLTLHAAPGHGAAGAGTSPTRFAVRGSRPSGDGGLCCQANQAPRTDGFALLFNISPCGPC